MRRSHTPALALLLAVLASPASAQIADDRLPVGAKIRIGSARFRVAGSHLPGALSPDGRTLALVNNSEILLLDTATGREAARLRSNEFHGAQSLTYFPDGRRLIAAGWNVPYLFDLPAGTGRPLTLSLPAGSEPNERSDGPVTLSADGTRLVRAGQPYGGGGPVRVWDTATGKPLVTVRPAQRDGHQAVLSPDGSRLVTFGRHYGRNEEERKQNLGGRVQVWDVATGKETGAIDTGGVQVVSAAFSPDGKLVATSAGGGAVKLWDAATGKPVRQFAGRRGMGHGLAFSRDGKHIAAHAGPAVQAWEVASGRRVGHFEGPGPVLGLRWRPDGRLVCWGYEGYAVFLGDVLDGKLLTPSGGPVVPTTAMVFADGGRTLLAADMAGRLTRWDAATGKAAGVVLPPRDDNNGSVSRYQQTFTAAGRWLAAAGNGGGVQLIDPATGREAFTLECPSSPPALGLAADGSSAVLATRHSDAAAAIELFDLETGQPRHRWPGPRGAVNAVACAPGGRRVAAAVYRNNPNGAGSQEFWMLDGQTGRQLTRRPEQYGAQAMAFAPDGRWLAVADGAGRLNLWDGDKGRPVLAFAAGSEAGPVWISAGPVFSPDGRSLAVARNRQNRQGQWAGVVVQVYEVASGTRRREWPGGHSGQVSALAFAPDGGTLASAGLDTTVVLWDLAGAETVTLKPGPLDTLWEGLAAAEARDADAAARQLRARPDEAAAFLAGRLTPVPRPALDEAGLKRLVAELGHANYGVRTRAERQLARVGPPAAAALRAALEAGADAEVQRRAAALLEQWERPDDLGPWLRPLRALEVLERLGTPAARQHLARLAAGDPHALLTREAAAALKRLTP
jgi:WD40 repeat protein